MTNWLTGWTRRKSHLITLSAGAGTLYQTLIKVYKTTGTDGTEVVNGITAGKIYVGSNCRDDFGDIRFTDNDGNTLLDYWMDPDYLVSGVSALFWVEVADTLESNATIYVYYKKDAAVNVSSGTNTFILFDHFDDSSLNSSLWTISSTYADRVSEPAGTAVLFDVRPASVSEYAGIKSVATFTNNIAILVRRKQTAENGYYVVMSIGAGGIGGTEQMPALKSGYEWRQYEPANLTGTNGIYECSAAGVQTAINASGVINGDNDAYYTYEARYYGATGILNFLINGVSKKSGADTTFLADNKNLLITQGSYSGGAYGQDTLVDYVIVRKFIATEPAHSTWGNEESGGGTAYNRTVVDIIGYADSKLKHKVCSLSFSEKLGALDSKVVSSIHHFLKTITEIMGILDAGVVKSKNAIKLILEKLAGVDAKGKFKDVFRSIVNVVGGLDARATLHSAIRIIGITKNSQGIPVGNCTVICFKTDDNSYISSTESDEDGNYSIYAPLDTDYFLVAFKEGEPDIQGVTVNTIQSEEVYL